MNAPSCLPMVALVGAVGLAVMALLVAVVVKLSAQDMEEANGNWY